MKNLIVINGAPGMGKTTISEELTRILPNNVMLECDSFMWSNPYVSTDEANQIRHENITFCLNNYLRCSAWHNVIVNWVFVNQETLDGILSPINLENISVHVFSLTCRNDIWKARMDTEAINMKRVVETTYSKWTERINNGYYNDINATIIDTSNLTAKQVAEKIASEVGNGKLV